MNNLKHLRGKAVVIIEYKGKFLFTVCFDQLTGQVFYIPVGGGIEFGEYSDVAAKREMLEEVGKEIINLELIDVSENIFKFNGIEEHEIVFVYKGDFKDQTVYESEQKGSINDKGNLIELTWATIDQIKENGINFYPPHLLSILG